MTSTEHRRAALAERFYGDQVLDHPNEAMIDFARGQIGLRINGRGLIVEDTALPAEYGGVPVETQRGRKRQRGLMVEPAGRGHAG